MCGGAASAAAEACADEMDAIDMNDGEVRVGSDRLQAALARGMAKLYDLAQPLEGSTTETSLGRVPLLLCWG